MKTIIFLICLIYSFNINALAINVYLKTDDKILKNNIKSFNRYLQNTNFLEKYKVQPFLNHHPLHITLYLTEYPSTALPELLNKVQKIATKLQPINASATQFNPTASHYLMIDVALKHADANHPLQQASDRCVYHLSGLRDIHAPIPPWARTIPSKYRAFLSYGSPNVYFEFAPHFSILAKKFDNEREGLAFDEELKALVTAYPSPFPVNFSLNTLAVGLVDDFGQITEEIAAYPLK